MASPVSFTAIWSAEVGETVIPAPVALPGGETDIVTA